MDDVIKLIAINDESYDAYGNPILDKTERTVFCKVRSVARNEFYQAAQTGLHPEFVFVLTHYKDYLGEPEILYDAFGAGEKLYQILRTYRNPETGELELVAGERVGDDGN